MGFSCLFWAAVNILQRCYGNFRILHMLQTNLHLLVPTGFKAVRGTYWFLQRGYFMQSAFDKAPFTFGSGGLVSSGRNNQASVHDQTPPLIVAAANSSPVYRSLQPPSPGCEGSRQEWINLPGWVSETSAKKRLHFKSKHFITEESCLPKWALPLPGRQDSRNVVILWMC